MPNLLALSYWFNPNPGPFLDQYVKFIYGFIVLAIVAGAMAWWFASKNSQNTLMCKFWSKVQSLCLTIGLGALALVLARQYHINLLAMPFLLLLLLIGAGVWVYFIVRYITVIVPRRRQDQEKKALKEKYL